MADLPITRIEVTLTEGENPSLKAFVNIELCGSFMIRGLKVLENHSGLWLAMPSKKNNRGEFRDVAHPTNQTTRRALEGAVLQEYSRVAQEKTDAGRPAKTS